MLSFYWMTAKIGHNKSQKKDDIVYDERRLCKGDRTWYTWKQYYEWAFLFFNKNHHDACQYWHWKMKVADATERRWCPRDRKWYNFNEYFCWAVTSFGSPRAASHHWNYNMKNQLDLDQVSSVNVADCHFPDLCDTVNLFDSPRTASDDGECMMKEHFDETDRKAHRRWGKFCMDQDSSVNVADRLSPDLRSTVLCTPHVAGETCKTQYFDIGDRNVIVEDSRASGNSSVSWFAQPANVPAYLLKNRETPNSYSWNPVAGQYFCKLCWAYATPEHVLSRKHSKRGSYPEYYDWDLWYSRLQKSPLVTVDFHAVD